ncbi:hypothetical protein LTR15_002756 [Elasticomyces elasticus]|nr:hypothetical protein LTR15_002756 [Elasticomyces elasticus]
MEKLQPPAWQPTIPAPPVPQRRSVLGRLLFAAICAAVILKSFGSTGSWYSSSTTPLVTVNKEVLQPKLDSANIWDTLPTNPKLEYIPCFEDSTHAPFECARLELPMDYWNGTTDAAISLAVIRSPAVVPVTDPSYGGAILLNPGGPGGSGVGLLLGSAKSVRETVDVVGKKHYDLISFDPRGVQNSAPRVECISNPALDHAWQLRVMEEGVYEASDAAMGRLWSMSIARSASCSLPHPDGEADIKKYVTTASVARDMLEIVERHGEWRETEAKRLLASTDDVPTDLMYKPQGEKIQYWGFSYGTYLGNTFAAMFPDRVGRLIVDGVVDAYNYKKTLWSDNLIDTERDWNGFFYHCARAGFPACALANKTGLTTAQGVSDRVFNITQSLYHNPLPVVSPSPEIVSYSDVKNLIAAANLLSDIEKGDGTRFAELLHAYHDFQCPNTDSATAPLWPLRNRTKGSGASNQDATTAIACSDGDDQSWLNRTEFEKYAREQAKLSPSVGSIWTSLRLSCIHYSVRPYARFEGPWIANTSHPLLLIGNTADPVTPVIHAINMAKGFTGAVALTQDSSGHCSISTYSNCTVQYVRRYFDTGELPTVNTTCPADEMPFGPGPDDADGRSVQLLEAKQRHANIAAALYAAGGSLMASTLGSRVAASWFE